MGSGFWTRVCVCVRGVRGVELEVSEVGLDRRWHGMGGDHGSRMGW